MFKNYFRMNENRYSKLELGFVDGTSNYEVLTDASAIALIYKDGDPFSAETSDLWDAIKVVSDWDIFQVLLEGTAGTEKEGRYRVYEFNSAGVITQKNPWRTGKQIMKLGYEEIFDIDIDGDSRIGKPPTDAVIVKSVGEGFKVVPKGKTIEVNDDNLGAAPPAFTVRGGTKSTKAVQINFEVVSKQVKPLDPEIPTKKGTIATAAPQIVNLQIEGVYFNSAAGNDTITGSSFSDFLRGGAGDDIIDCGAGNDVVRIGDGDDRLTLGAGADILYLTADQLQGSENTLVDFVVDEDQVLIDARLEPYISIEDVDGGVSINLSGPADIVGEGGITQLFNDAMTSTLISFG